MSDRVTWDSCPRCGERAAVGWASSPRTGAAAEERPECPVEFDCTAGCRVGLEAARAHLRRGSAGPG